MFDWLSSKVAMSVAALIIVASMVAFFSMQRESMHQLEFQNIADTIAKTVNDVSASTASFKKNITFNKDKSGARYIPATFYGKTYLIIFYLDSVDIKQGGLKARASFSKKVHLYNPSTLNNSYLVSKSELRWRDSGNLTMTLTSGQSDICLEQKTLCVDGETEFHTFVYLA